MPFTDRLDYLAAMSANQGYAMAVEKLLGCEVPPRAEYLRVFACELNRIASHLIATGAMAMDIGAFTPFLHWLREREYINDFMEALCGSRLTYNYMRIGGVSQDLPDGMADRVLRWLDHFVPIIDEFDRLITGNEIFVKRLAGVAAIRAEDALDFGLVGPNLRASGVDWDLRRDLPYSAYPDFQFDVPLGRGFRGTLGDCYDRFVAARPPRPVRVLPDPAATAAEDARGRYQGQAARAAQASPGRGLRARGGPARRNGLLPDQRRPGNPLSLEGADRFIYRDVHHRKTFPRSHDRGPRRHHREPGRDRSGGGPLTMWQVKRRATSSSCSSSSSSSASNFRCERPRAWRDR